MAAAVDGHFEDVFVAGENAAEFLFACASAHATALLSSLTDLARVDRQFGWFLSYPLLEVAVLRGDGDGVGRHKGWYFDVG